MYFLWRRHAELAPVKNFGQVFNHSYQMLPASYNCRRGIVSQANSAFEMFVPGIRQKIFGHK
jgi:hypothetical protein